MKLVGKLTEAELERRIADGSLKAELKAELAAEGKTWSEIEWQVATQIFGYTELDDNAPEDAPPAEAK
jgi:uncharacterized protein YfiM (DUF2279 family)